MRYLKKKKTENESLKPIFTWLILMVEIEQITADPVSFSVSPPDSCSVIKLRKLCTESGLIPRLMICLHQMPPMMSKTYPSKNSWTPSVSSAACSKTTIINAQKQKPAPQKRMQQYRGIIHLNYFLRNKFI